MSRHHHGCGSRGRFEFNLPEALMAMRGGRGWQGGWGPFNFDFDSDGWGGGGRRGRRTRRMFESGELRLVLLKLIADEPRHGYDLIRAIEELTGGEYAPSPGIIYPTLTLLQDMGLIDEAPGEGPRKSFQVTDEGRAHLDERSDEIEALFERLADLKPRSENMAGPAIGRAVKNLMTALGHRLKAEGFDEDLFLEVAAILDEAAQKIERVKPSKDEPEEE
ncbi:MAG TPA: PadR family transcriptional regulator [Sphingomicrobium sp.]|jgi:DNA-binding PadR family transcriptional regulator|nr:PadR family transcriptional regulator [Sphingomicrobium sp.]